MAWLMLVHCSPFAFSSRPSPPVLMLLDCERACAFMCLAFAFMCAVCFVYCHQVHMSTIEVLVTNGDTDLSRVHINHGADLSMDSLVRCVAVPDEAAHATHADPP